MRHRHHLVVGPKNDYRGPYIHIILDKCVNTAVVPLLQSGLAETQGKVFRDPTDRLVTFSCPDEPIKTDCLPSIIPKNTKDPLIAAALKAKRENRVREIIFITTDDDFDGLSPHSPSASKDALKKYNTNIKPLVQAGINLIYINKNKNLKAYSKQLASALKNHPGKPQFYQQAPNHWELFAPLLLLADPYQYLRAQLEKYDRRQRRLSDDEYLKFEQAAREVHLGQGELITMLIYLLHVKRHYKPMSVGVKYAGPNQDALFVRFPPPEQPIKGPTPSSQQGCSL